MAQAAKRTKLAKDLKDEIVAACKELGLEYTPTIAKLYVRARNRGYRNGYSARDKRARNST